MSTQPAEQAPGTLGDVTRVALHGTLDLSTGKALWNTLREVKPGPNGRQVAVDLSEVIAADGSAAAILTSYVDELRSQGVHCELVGANENVSDVLRLYAIPKLGPRPRRKAQGQLDQIGNAAIAVALEAQMVIAFFGQMVVGVINAFRAPRTVNWKELSPTI
jgi:ABC-type transporter Mla MlaB component